MQITIGQAVFWLIILILMLAIEFPTMGLTTIWFAGGAFVTIFLSFFKIGFTLQMIIFLAISIFLLVSIRPWAKEHFNNNRTQTNAESLIGREAVVTESIDNVHSKGHVFIDGMEWSARGVETDEKFVEGETVTIQKISGVKLIVSKGRKEKC